MKFVFISFLAFLFGFSSPIFTENEEAVSFLVEITHADGTTDSKTINLNQVASGYDAVALDLVVYSGPGGGNCTWGWSNSDECKTTAPNCRAAQAGFEACACELDNSHPFCDGGGVNP
ncbi:hypothetical protein FUA23_01890 [Neolewinella aurantiaca]|uniref:Uncharacterized protein n=1 Tax=Neolewinella aurantiaca TaxID=2602767 RepID=A0A5C7G070_9BACT|nr:hypothetical protein [Neolewinella aurantiaca]TXF91470.1 hypothetical protein FUA23_01890 [Neolewinella aurantiaca]